MYFSKPYYQEFRQERFIGPLIPFVGGALIGGLVAYGTRPNNNVPTYPPYYQTYIPYPVPYQQQYQQPYQVPNQQQDMNYYQPQYQSYQTYENNYNMFVDEQNK